MIRPRFGLLVATLLLAAGAPAVAVPVGAATLRPFVTLHARLVRLSDLFAGVPKAADRTLGPGPAPGQRIIVPAPQLDAIAAEFGIDWHPASAADQAILERRGVPLAEAALRRALRLALEAAGAPADGAVDLGTLAPPLVPPSVRPRITVERAAYDPRSGAFAAWLAIAAPRMPTEHIAVRGQVQPMVMAVVATRRMRPGTLLTAHDVTLARVPAMPAGGQREMMRHIGAVLGLELRRIAVAGQPIPRAALRRPRAVRRGALVRLHLSVPGLAVSAAGVALDGGPVGATIRVRNPASGAVLAALVTGPGRARVVPGTAPLLAPGRGAGIAPAMVLR